MKQKHFLISLAVLATGISVGAQTKDNVKTTFQTSREWKPSIDNRADGVWSRRKSLGQVTQTIFRRTGKVLEGARIYHTLYDRYCLG